MRWSLVVAACLLLAGCAEPGAGDEGTDSGDGGGAGGGLAPQHHHAEAAEAGLRAEGDLSPCDGGFCIDARAWNDVGETFHVSSQCVPPWSERMARDGGTVQHREPMAYCAMFATEPFPPGASQAINASWDGRVWDDGAQRTEPAPQGAYVWSLTFRAYRDADGGGPVDLVLEFPVVVGAT